MTCKSLLKVAYCMDSLALPFRGARHRAFLSSTSLGKIHPSMVSNAIALCRSGHPSLVCKVQSVTCRICTQGICWYAGP